MEIKDQIFAELYKLHRKLDRLTSLVSGIPTTHHSDLGEWLTEEQARELLQRGATSLWGLRKQKKIVASKIGNRTYYHHESILAYLEKNKIK